MRNLFILSTLLLLVTACEKNAIRGSGSNVSETRTVAAFKGVKAQGDLNVEIKKGTQQRVVVSGYENLVPIFETFVTNGTLVLKFKGSYNIRNSNISVAIEVPELEAASIDGSGNTIIKDFNGLILSASINGSGRIQTSNNRFANAHYSINGSGVIRAAQVDAANVVASINGSGTIDAACSESLKATIRGSGEINYWGTPTFIETDISGSGSIKKR